MRVVPFGMGALSKHQDPIAVVLSSVVGMLGALGLIERAGLTADQVAQLMGFAMAILAAVRTPFERKRHREMEDLRREDVIHRARVLADMIRDGDTDGFRTTPAVRAPPRPTEGP